MCPDVLTESEKKFVANGGIILSGKLQEADAKNGNGRIYPRKILEREMKNYQKLIEERRALGELDHPDTSVVNLANCSHMVTEVSWKGPEVHGKIKVLNTPAGQILKALVEEGVKLGISSRGLGSVTEDKGNTIVEDDFQLICFDMVSEPSTNEAYMIKEGRNKALNTMTKSDRIWRALNDVLEGE